MATTSGSDTALRRKLASTSRGENGGARSALRALRMAVARAAAAQTGLQVAVIGATQARCTLDMLADRLPEGWMHVLLDGPNDRSGGLCLDRACVAALVQQQTAGRIVPGQVSDREFTTTDCALVAPFLDDLLCRAADLVETAPDQDCLAGYRFGARMESGRRLVLALEEEKLRIFELTLEIAAGGLQGAMWLVLPDNDRGTVPAEASAARSGSGLEKVFGSVRADLVAVVGSARVPLTKLSNMVEGDMLPLDSGRLDQTEIVTIDGRSVATGKLGQSGGWRALRLGHPELADAGQQDGSVFSAVSPRSATVAKTVQPRTDTGVAKDAGPALSADLVEEEEFEERLMSLSPEQAAVEISELAGLPVAQGEEMSGSQESS